jgi:outer membrane biosynthesis protein TonB
MRKRYMRFSNLLTLMLILASLTAAQDKQAAFASGPKFVLSQELVNAGIHGLVTVTIAVSKDGSVKNVDVLGGPSWPCGSSLDAEIHAVHQAVKQHLMSTRFQPALKNGKPVDATVQGEFPIVPALRSSPKEKSVQNVADVGTSPAAVDAGVVNGKAVRLPRPSYPMSGRGGGTIRVQVLIDESGAVRSAGALRGHAALRKAARTAACGARFSPTLILGKPVKVQGVITYYFR